MKVLRVNQILWRVLFGIAISGCIAAQICAQTQNQQAGQVAGQGAAAVGAQIPPPPQIRILNDSGKPIAALQKSDSFTIQVTIPPGTEAADQTISVTVDSSTAGFFQTKSQTVTLTQTSTGPGGTTYESQSIQIDTTYEYQNWPATGVQTTSHWIGVSNGGGLVFRYENGGPQSTITVKAYDTPLQQAAGETRDLFTLRDQQLTNAIQLGDSVIAGANTALQNTTDPAERSKLQQVVTDTQQAVNLAKDQKTVIANFFRLDNYWKDPNVTLKLGYYLTPFITNPTTYVGPDSREFSVRASQAAYDATQNAPIESFNNIVVPFAKLTATTLYGTYTSMTLSGPLFTLASPLFNKFGNPEGTGGYVSVGAQGKFQPDTTGGGTLTGTTVMGAVATRDDYLGAARDLVIAVAGAKLTPVVAEHLATQLAPDLMAGNKLETGPEFVAGGTKETPTGGVPATRGSKGISGDRTTRANTVSTAEGTHPLFYGETKEVPHETHIAPSVQVGPHCTAYTLADCIRNYGEEVTGETVLAAARYALKKDVRLRSGASGLWNIESLEKGRLTPAMAKAAMNELGFRATDAGFGSIEELKDLLDAGEVWVVVYPKPELHGGFQGEGTHSMRVVKVDVPSGKVQLANTNLTTRIPGQEGGQILEVNYNTFKRQTVGSIAQNGSPDDAFGMLIRPKQPIADVPATRLASGNATGSGLSPTINLRPNTPANESGRQAGLTGTTVNSGATVVIFGDGTLLISRAGDTDAAFPGRVSGEGDKVTLTLYPSGTDLSGQKPLPNPVYSGPKPDWGTHYETNPDDKSGKVIYKGVQVSDKLNNVLGSGANTQGNGNAPAGGVNQVPAETNPKQAPSGQLQGTGNGGNKQQQQGGTGTTNGSTGFVPQVNPNFANTPPPAIAATNQPTNAVEIARLPVTINPLTASNKTSKDVIGLPEDNSGTAVNPELPGVPGISWPESLTEWGNPQTVQVPSDSNNLTENAANQPVPPPPPVPSGGAGAGSTGLKVANLLLLNATNTAVNAITIHINQDIAVSDTEPESAHNIRSDPNPQVASTARRVPGRMELAAFRMQDPLSATSGRALLSRRADEDSQAVDLSKAIYSIVANGKASGPVADLQFFDPTGRIQDPILPSGTILEPVKLGSAKSVMDMEPGAKIVRKRLIAFCVDYAKLPPEPGMLYRVAPAAVQARYGDVASALQASRELAEANAYTPDTNADAYKRDIAQYSLWANIHQWNQQQFAEVFLEKIKANAAAAHVQWSPQMEQSVMQLVPGRWRDIMLVMQRAAEIAKRKQAQKPAGPKP